MTTTTYNISNIKQLIDLNGESVNFHLNFKATSLSNENFDALVVTQEMLDSNDPLVYQKADGEISGQIKNENGTYNNYFLCLKSDTPMEIEVSIDLTELQVQKEVQQQVQQQQKVNQPSRVQPRKSRQQQQPSSSSKEVTTTTSSKSEFNYVVFGIIFAILVIGVGLFFYFRSRSDAVVPAVEEPQSSELLLKNVKDGFNDLEIKLNEVTTKVTNNLNDNLGSKLNEVTAKVTNNLTDNLGARLNEVTSKVTDNFGKLHHQMSENISSTADIGDIKESINNIKSQLQMQYSPPSISTPTLSTPISTPISVPTLSAPTLSAPIAPPSSPLISHDASSVINNGEDVLSTLMKIRNKQA
jgi:hypothetical protein